MDQENCRFYVWMGDATIEKFTKSTFMNLVDFAEKAGATSIILIQTRAHPQKNEFHRLFKVLDAERMHKADMSSIFCREKLAHVIEKYALHTIKLD